jgi:hypothetical protein
MKRIVKIGLTMFLTFLFSASLINAQEKKNEQRIKIIVADREGTKIEIDTLIKGGLTADSIKLKNGEVIFLSGHGVTGKVKHVEGKDGQMYVTVTSDDNKDKKTMKEITVVSGDSEHVMMGSEGGDVIIIKNGKHIKAVKGESIVTMSSTEGNSKGESVVYINNVRRDPKEGEKTYNIKVVTDDKGDKLEKTKYVIAKDGMVISVEGSDEAKVKDLVKDIESKMGVSKTEKNSKQIVKEETKTTTKK